MALTAAQYRALIVAQFGDDPAVAESVDLLWAKNDDQANVALQYLYTRRDVIDLLLTRARSQVDFRALNGASVSLSQLTENLQRLRQTVEDEIAGEIAEAGGYQSGEIATQAPVAPPYPWMSDANAPRYRGSPYDPPGPLIGGGGT